MSRILQLHCFCVSVDLLLHPTKSDWAKILVAFQRSTCYNNHGTSLLWFIVGLVAALYQIWSPFSIPYGLHLLGESSFLRFSWCFPGVQLLADTGVNNSRLQNHFKTGHGSLLTEKNLRLSERNPLFRRSVLAHLRLIYATISYYCEICIIIFEKTWRI